MFLILNEKWKNDDIDITKLITVHIIIRSRNITTYTEKSTLKMQDAVKMLKSKECNREFEIVKVWFVDIFGDRNDRFYPRTYVIDKEDYE